MSQVDRRTLPSFRQVGYQVVAPDLVEEGRLLPYSKVVGYSRAEAIRAALTPAGGEARVVRVYWELVGDDETPR